MRIIAGQMGGRQFDSPRGHVTHPMSEKVRGALFNMLGDISGLTVLDAYAGSGAISYEAISRGASQVIAIELDKTAQNTIRDNVQQLHMTDKINLYPGSCVRWTFRNRDALFDIVICDPPYDRVLIRDIQRLSNHVKLTGILVLSWPGHLKPDQLKGFEQIKIQTYGDAQLIFYRRNTN